MVPDTISCPVVMCYRRYTGGAFLKRTSGRRLAASLYTPSVGDLHVDTGPAIWYDTCENPVSFGSGPRPASR